MSGIDAKLGCAYSLVALEEANVSFARVSPQQHGWTMRAVCIIHMTPSCTKNAQPVICIHQPALHVCKALLTSMSSEWYANVCVAERRWST